MVQRALAAVAALLLALPTTASASRLLRDSNGRWETLGTSNYVINIDGSVPPFLAASLREAGMEWGNDVARIDVSETGLASQANVLVTTGDCDIQRPDGVHPNYACWTYQGDHGTLRFDLRRIGPPKLRLKLSGFYVGLACVELGHAFGLEHGGQGCMTLWPIATHHPLYRPAVDSFIGLLRRHNLLDRAGIALQAFDVLQSKPGMDDVLLLDRVYG